MKKIAFLTVLFSLVLFFSTSVLAEKPSDNKAGASKYGWHLSGEVMPVPPYGSSDIVGSDSDSKLIVNRPNGKVKANITGVMKGLNPSTTYTVYLSNGYTPKVLVDVTGEWTWTVLGVYTHDIHIDTQYPDGTFSGTGGWPSGTNSYQTTETITGQVVGNTITFTTHYNGSYNTGYEVTVTGTINDDGSITGTSPWSWTAPADSVTSAVAGSSSWPGFLPGMSAFTFTTDNTGSGSWHYNLMKLVTEFSVWINEAGKTVLISDSVTL